MTLENQPQRLFPGWRHHALWKDESVFFSPQRGHLPTKDSTNVLSGYTWLISEHSIQTSPSIEVRSGCQLAIFISFPPGYIFSHMAIFFPSWLYFFLQPGDFYFPTWQYFFPPGNMLGKVRGCRTNCASETWTAGWAESRNWINLINVLVVSHHFMSRYVISFQFHFI